MVLQEKRVLFGMNAKSRSQTLCQTVSPSRRFTAILLRRIIYLIFCTGTMHSESTQMMDCRRPLFLNIIS